MRKPGNSIAECKLQPHRGQQRCRLRHNTAQHDPRLRTGVLPVDFDRGHFYCGVLRHAFTR